MICYFILFSLSGEEKTLQIKQMNPSWFRKQMRRQREALKGASFSFQEKDKYKAKIRILF